MTSKAALLIVDVQNDFLPGGTLAVPRGNEVIPPLNTAIEYFRDAGLPIFATRDWHPPGHCSFHDAGGPWPPHGIAESAGAAFPDALALPANTRIVSKATEPGEEAYSGFAGTGLADRLRAEAIETLFIGGLATDYCVVNTVRDALEDGFRVFLLEDALRAVDVNPGDGERALAEMERLGARMIRSDRIAA